MRGVAFAAAASFCAVPETGAFLQTGVSVRPRTVMMAGDPNFVPSENYFREVLGKQGLRYSMSKTPAEVAKEGDYSIFEAMFGQTSNNAARLALKKEVRVKTSKPSDPAASKAWLDKYGWPRFFPAYVDRSGESDEELPPPAADIIAPPKAKAPMPSVKLSTFKPAVQSAPSKVIAKGPVPNAVKAAKPVAAKPAAPKAMPKAPAAVKAVAKPVAAAAKPVVEAVKAAPAAAAKPIKAVLKAAPAKTLGNLANIPKQLSK